jgi:hypothetical protein
MSKPAKAKEAKAPEKVKEILGSRVLPKFIMYDGEGKYVRRYINS